jgi:SAM-dependent methyltransferase
MDTLKKVGKIFGVDINQPSPIFLKEKARTKDLPRLFRKLGFKIGAEIGSMKGWYARFLFTYITGLKLYCVDSWEAYDEFIESHIGANQEKLNDCFEIAKERLRGLNVEFIKKRSMDAVKDFADESLDFVYIDANHTFEYVVEDIAKWEKKVRKGGIVAGHDYWTSIEMKKLWIEKPTELERLKLCQVKDAIDAWTKANLISPLFVIEEKTSFKSPSWFYVKQ